MHHIYTTCSRESDSLELIDTLIGLGIESFRSPVGFSREKQALSTRIVSEMIEIAIV